MKTVGLLVAVVASFFAAYLFLDTRFAKCAEVKVIERRLDYKIANDKPMGIQQRQWQLEEKYPDKSKAPQETQIQMKELGAALERQKAVVDKMEGSKD